MRVSNKEKVMGILPLNSREPKLISFYFKRNVEKESAVRRGERRYNPDFCSYFHK